MRIAYDILSQGPILELLKREDLCINLDYENGNLDVHADRMLTKGVKQ